jgi:hypothetical protein
MSPLTETLFNASLFWWPILSLPTGFFLAWTKPNWLRRCCFGAVGIMPLLLMLASGAIDHCKPFGGAECMLGWAGEFALLSGLIALAAANAVAWGRRQFGPQS